MGGQCSSHRLMLSLTPPDKSAYKILWSWQWHITDGEWQ